MQVQRHHHRANKASSFPLMSHYSRKASSALCYVMGRSKVNLSTLDEQWSCFLAPSMKQWLDGNDREEDEALDTSTWVVFALGQADGLIADGFYSTLCHFQLSNCCFVADAKLDPSTFFFTPRRPWPESKPFLSSLPSTWQPLLSVLHAGPAQLGQASTPTVSVAHTTLSCRADFMTLLAKVRLQLVLIVIMICWSSLSLLHTPT